VHLDEFIGAMALLNAPEKGTTLDEQIETTFAMFDTTGQGQLTYLEFRSMMEATVTLNLQRMLATDIGEKNVEQQLKKEYSQENIEFWRKAREYRDSHASRSDAENAKLATEIILRFVVEGVDEEVNLPSAVKEAILCKDPKYSKSESAPFKKVPAEAADQWLLNDAEQDIYKLMERDAFARFKSDPDAVGRVVNEFFQSADVDHDGLITFPEFRRWVATQPSVLIFLSQVSRSVYAALQQHKRRQTVDMDIT